MHPAGLVLAASLFSPIPAAWADVSLMAGQTARPLRGSFNIVPVLHSNQPEKLRVREY